MSSSHSWAELIAAAWRQSVNGVIRAGQLLNEAKAALPHGEYLQMVENALPFKARTAQRLMAIAQDERITNATHATLLPQHWTTLYDLTQLDDTEFEAKITDGTIHPEMQRRDVAQSIKRKHRDLKEKLLGEFQASLPNKKFNVIVADPEWRFEPWSRDTGMDRAADNHYPTSCTEVIAARDVPAISAKDCVLFLWATIPMLPHALLVMSAWGFDYKSHYVWGKDKRGTGYWNFEKHELLLIGTRGKIPCPSPGTQGESFQLSPRLRHSEKPESFLEMIERWYPTLPKIELNRRGKARAGWHAWGNESEHAGPGLASPASEPAHDVPQHACAGSFVSDDDVIDLPGVFGRGGATGWRTSLE